MLQFKTYIPIKSQAKQTYNQPKRSHLLLKYFRLYIF